MRKQLLEIGKPIDEGKQNRVEMWKEAKSHNIIKSKA